MYLSTCSASMVTASAHGSCPLPRLNMPFPIVLFVDVPASDAKVASRFGWEGNWMRARNAPAMAHVWIARSNPARIARLDSLFPARRPLCRLNSFPLSDHPMRATCQVISSGVGIGWRG